jgi:hypothetical protein
VPWLTVLGAGSWRCGDKRFPAGKHEVDETTAELARQAGIRSLIITETEPTLHRREDGPLTIDDVKLGSGVRLAIVPPPEVADVEPDLYEVPRDYHCPHCEESHPSRGSLLRHIEFHHDVKR